MILHVIYTKVALLCAAISVPVKLSRVQHSTFLLQFALKYTVLLVSKTGCRMASSGTLRRVALVRTDV
jgi:hypothetical protein